MNLILQTASLPLGLILQTVYLPLSLILQTAFLYLQLLYLILARLKFVADQAQSLLQRIEF